jgi:hypothetical protein
MLIHREASVLVVGQEKSVQPSRTMQLRKRG